MTTYLFYNPDNSADRDLANTAPEGVTPVPMGWRADTEAQRQQLLFQLGVSGVSALPCLLHHIEAGEGYDPETDETYPVPARWAELRIAGRVERPWTHDKIAQAVQEQRDAIMARRVVE